MQANQLSLFPVASARIEGTIRERVIALLSGDLDFHKADSGYSSHQFHSFPAKYPPQLPRKFIDGLTEPGETVLNPMMGSGTTLVEALLAERKPIGFDTDPLAIRIAKAKTMDLDKPKVLETGNAILNSVYQRPIDQRDQLREEYHSNWDSNTSKFVNYWFHSKTQGDLCTLMNEIRRIPDETLRTFFEIIFSAIIITKSGGVSVALDLAHTRPHRAKILHDSNGDILWGKEKLDQPSARLPFLSKKLRPVFDEFSNRFQRNFANLPDLKTDHPIPEIKYGNAKNIPLAENSIDLIVTSPPYASNAIDYIRAHKFSLIWMGFSVNELAQRRSRTIGGESTAGMKFEKLPSYTRHVIQGIEDCDPKKGRVLHRYYSEMTQVLREMYRILKPGKVAILVVGSSNMRGRDTETGECLTEIGRKIGFDVPAIGIRNIDRNRRMMPVGAKLSKDSQIQKRMHQEFVIGFLKMIGEGLGIAG